MSDFLIALMDKFGTEISFVLLGFAMLITMWALSLQWYYGEKRIAARMASHFGLSDELIKPGLCLNFCWSSIGEARVLHIEYMADLHDEANGLSLSPEGVKSGLAAMGGAQEQTTGDVDFDDYFWIGGGDIEYLSPARRAFLLHAFPGLSADASIVRGLLRGRIPCEQSPWGIAAAIRVLERVEYLRSGLEYPENSQLAQRPGWVARKQCRAAAAYCWLAAIPVFAIAFVVDCGWESTMSNYDILFVCGLSVTGLLLSGTGAALFAGSRVAMPLARLAQVLGSLTILSTAPYWLKAATMLGILMCPIFALVMIRLLHQSYARLSRLRLV